jgi:TDG/mug DNA glycosylase family protein
MERGTVDVYDQRGLAWAATHATAARRLEAAAFAHRVTPGAVRLDMGCGAGRYLPHLGARAVAFDASPVMLDACRRAVPDALYVRADVEHLPFARHSVGGAWSQMTHLHVPRERLPLALWDAHRVLAVDAPFEVQVLEGEYEGDDLPGDEVGGRYFAGWTPSRLVDVVTGAGFDVEPDSVVTSGDQVGLRAVRARTLADTVGPGMRLLMCGVNPSLYSADAGVGYGRPGNRFWPAALAAGIVTRDRDPHHAVAHHGVGMTDFVKRATRTAAEVTDDEYGIGFARVERLVEWLRPGAVCFVGLSGWRSAVDGKAKPGVQPGTIGGRPAYLMPSTSGLNARVSVGELAAHLAAAAELAEGARSGVAGSGPGRRGPGDIGPGHA